MFAKDQMTRFIDLLGCREGDPERSAILFVDGCANICGARLIEGGCDRLELPVGQILLDGIALRTRQVMIVHTHPSGDPRPSGRDVTTTRLLCQRLRRQGHRLFDHIIVTNRLYFSFRANRLL